MSYYGTREVKKESRIIHVGDLILTDEEAAEIGRKAGGTIAGGAALVAGSAISGIVGTEAIIGGAELGTLIAGPVGTVAGAAVGFLGYITMTAATGFIAAAGRKKGSEAGRNIARTVTAKHYKKFHFETRKAYKDCNGFITYSDWTTERTWIEPKE
jgi:hypothetical protein